MAGLSACPAGISSGGPFASISQVATYEEVSSSQPPDPRGAHVRPSQGGTSYDQRLMRPMIYFTRRGVWKALARAALAGKRKFEHNRGRCHFAGEGGASYLQIRFEEESNDRNLKGRRTWGTRNWD